MFLYLFGDNTIEQIVLYPLTQRFGQCSSLFRKCIVINNKFQSINALEFHLATIFTNMINQTSLDTLKIKVKDYQFSENDVERSVNIISTCYVTQNIQLRMNIT